VGTLRELAEFGQSAWLDELRRDWLFDGTLRRYIEVDGIRGVTTNPAIFAHALQSSMAYDGAIDALALRQLPPRAALRQIAIEDVRSAAALFAGVFRRSAGADGYVSLEVDPALVNDASGTVADARRLWQELDSPNVMIKVPATRAGLQAAMQLLANGINVNLTLIFSRARLADARSTYVNALELRVAAGHDVGAVRCVASVFVSRIDSWVDATLARTQPGLLRSLGGRAAVALATLAYDDWCLAQGDARWRRLATLGARPQSLLWASTSMKNPRYPPTLYVDSLIGAETITTLPVVTMAAFRAYGRAGRTLPGDTSAAREVLGRLAAVGVDVDGAGRQLEADGIAKFAAAHAITLERLAQRLRQPDRRSTA